VAVDLSALKTGIYSLKATAQNDVTQTIKIAKD